MINELKAYNALNVATACDYRKLKKLYDMYGSWAEALAGEQSSYKVDAEKEWDKLGEHGIELALNGDSHYPKLLKEIPWVPHGIYYRGKLSMAPTVAIVGTRKASDVGRKLAFDFGKDLAGKGMTVASGLALGVDAAAHEGALEAGGVTLAVLAVGLDRVYPARHQALAEKIIQSGGGLISEYPIGMVSYEGNFIQRNRIVSGLSLGTIVIEAPEKSGALATARFALDQNREVMVTPGPARHPNYAGSHGLIKAGAQLITSPDDVLESLGLSSKEASGQTLELPNIGGDEARVCAVLKTEGRKLNVDKISDLSKIHAQDVSRLLTFLVMRGIIKETTDGQYYI